MKGRWKIGCFQLHNSPLLGSGLAERKGRGTTQIESELGRDTEQKNPESAAPLRPRSIVQIGTDCQLEVSFFLFHGG